MEHLEFPCHWKCTIQIKIPQHSSHFLIVSLTKGSPFLLEKSLRFTGDPWLVIVPAQWLYNEHSIVHTEVNIVCVAFNFLPMRSTALFTPQWRCGSFLFFLEHLLQVTTGSLCTKGLYIGCRLTMLWFEPPLRRKMWWAVFLFDVYRQYVQGFIVSVAAGRILGEGG